MNENAHNVGGALAGLGMLMFLLLLGLAVYLFTCFCYKRICEKCGKNPGALIWIPIAQFVPLLEAANMPIWTIVLMFIPLVNLVWMIMLFIPVANIIFLPYLAFSE